MYYNEDENRNQFNAFATFVAIIALVISIEAISIGLMI